MPDVPSDTARISLPKPLTSFIGRERELAQARRLLADSYLVTLTGPGGSGKTRLCIAVATAVASDYPNGVYFVPLAPVRAALRWYRQHDPPAAPSRWSARRVIARRPRSSRSTPAWSRCSPAS